MLGFASIASANNEVLCSGYGDDSEPLDVTVTGRSIREADIEGENGSYSLSLYGVAAEYK